MDSKRTRIKGLTAAGLLTVTLLCAWSAGVAQSSADQGKKPAGQTAANHQREYRHDRRFQPQQFERPERAKWQKPDEVVARLKLQPGQVLADIGAGSGYFSRRFARAVSPKGRVYAVDIDQKMLRYIQQDARILGLPQIVTVLASQSDPMLAPRSVDVIFLCNTIRHIPSRADYYRRLVRALRLGGRLVIVEFVKRKLPVGPPPEMKIARQDMIEEVTAGGFRLSEDVTELLPYQYLLIFEVDRMRQYHAELRRQVAYGISQGRSLAAIRRDIDVPDEFAEISRSAPTPDVNGLYRKLTTFQLPDADGEHEQRRPHTLALIADRYHEPAHIEIGLTKAFKAAGIDLTITVDYRHLSAENLKKVDLFVILRDGMNWPQGYEKPYVQWITDEQQQAMADFVRAGGGFLALHNCTGIYPPDGPYYEVLAGQYNGHSPIEPFEVQVADPHHPVTRGVGPYRILDEQHYPTFDEKRVKLLLRSRSRHGEYPAGWAYEYGKGRVCYLANGHTPEAIEHPMFQLLMRNAIRWCLRLEDPRN